MLKNDEKLFYILTALLPQFLCGPHRMVVEHAEFANSPQTIRIGTTWKEYTH
jgi:hypothetical protein